MSKKSHAKKIKRERRRTASKNRSVRRLMLRAAAYEIPYDVMKTIAERAVVLLREQPHLANMSDAEAGEWARENGHLLWGDLLSSMTASS